MKEGKMIRLEREEIDVIQEYADTLEISFSAAARKLLKYGIARLKEIKNRADENQLTFNL